MRAVSLADLPYRDFYYPLNVFMHILGHEEGGARYLHYGLFENENESIAAAQEHSTDLLLAHLPPPPARVLDVGTGLGTTLARLTDLGYEATGITPDEKQVAMVRSVHGDRVRVVNIAFENLFPQGFDVVFFQESAQYIKPAALFAKAREVTNTVLVLDEFSTAAGQPLHLYSAFLEAASAYRFVKREEIDLSARAAPTVAYFPERIAKYRRSLIDDLGVSDQQIDDLLASGKRYGEMYAKGTYVYRFLRFERPR